MSGTVDILGVGTGHTKIIFNRDDPAECIRAGRIIKDMLNRGYALLVEATVEGKKIYQRAKEFDEEHNEYIIADFDPRHDAANNIQRPEKTDVSQEAAAQAPPPVTAKKVGRPRKLRRCPQCESAIKFLRSIGRLEHDIDLSMPAGDNV